MKKTAAEALAVIDSAGLAAENFAYGRGGCVGYFVKTADGTIAPYGKRVLDALESEEKWVTARSSRKEAARSVVPTPQTTAGQALLDLRRQHPLPEYGPAALGQLPQLRAARRPVGESSRNLHGAEPGTDFGNQRDPRQADGRQRRAVYLREGRQYVLPFHDRRVSGHFAGSVEQFRPAARKRGRAIRRRTGAAGGRRQAVESTAGGAETGGFWAVRSPRGSKTRGPRRSTRTTEAKRRSSSSTTA